ncbi:MAG: DUF4314 domain-containing protein [Lachnospiraceae bacterium]|nr:DUF4314 domain-containing protein [Lachnospiraceae bacterium]MBQ8948004.1 DUF4314 domain-containing protein [Lachnospiraceae bacterium]
MREKLFPGMRMVVDKMNDPQPLAQGSQGSFEGYDGVGDLLISWDNGSQLKLIPSVDRYHVISSDEEINTSLAHLREEQEKIDRDESFTCPRCGKKSSFRTRALSRIADISVCEGCGTMEAIIQAQQNGIRINIQGADADTARDFKRIGLREWKIVREWQGLEDID